MILCALICGFRFQSELEEKNLNRERKGKALKKLKSRQVGAKVEPLLDEQFMGGRVLGELSLASSDERNVYFFRSIGSCF